MRNNYNHTNLNNLANHLVAILKERDYIFEPIDVVVPSTQISKWFKAYWLKTQNDILMNVNFISFQDFVLSNLILEKKYNLASQELIKSILIKILSNKENYMSDSLESRYVFDSEEINPIRLYDFANSLASLYQQYDQDCFIPLGFEKEIFDLCEKELEGLSYGNLGHIFSKSKGFARKNETVYFFGFINFSKLEDKILSEYESTNDCSIFSLEEDLTIKPTFKYSSAPSKVKEIEYVHSSICDLISNGANPNDVIVVANDLVSYENDITRVFKQDNESFPDVRFTIKDNQKVDGEVATLLKKLFEIKTKGFYTRTDFFEIINLKVVQQARGIEEKDVITWPNSIFSMNVFRNSESSDDWEYAKKRLLLSKISNLNSSDDSCVILSDGHYISYNEIGLDDASIIRFVNFVDDMHSWLDLMATIMNADKDSIDSILVELDKWLSIKDENGFETSKAYKRVKELLFTWNLFDISNKDIPIDTLLYSIFETAKISKFNSGELFAGGVSFVNFDSKAIYSAKYVYFIGMSSDKVPAIRIQSELDQRDDFDKCILEDKKAFNLLFQNTTERFTATFVNKDLQTDEDFFPSSYILDILSRYEEKIECEEVSIDETRPWNELYTKKEFKNKSYFTGLLDTKGKSVSPNKEEYSTEPIKKLSLTNLADFLKEPLSYKAKRLFGRNDNVEDDLSDEYEPLQLDNLSFAAIIKKLLIEMLNNKKTKFTEAEIDHFLSKFDLEHKLPIISNNIKKFSLLSACSECLNVFGQIQLNDPNDFEVIKLNDKTYECNKKQWVLMCNKEVCRCKIENKLSYFELKKFAKDGKKLKDNSSELMYLYVFALMDVSNFDDDNDYDIALFRNNATLVPTFTLNRKQATALLNAIYEEAIDFTDNYCLPVNILFDAKIDNLAKLIDKSDDYWKFYDDAKIFNLDTDLGYEDKEFAKQLKARVEKRIKLIKFLDEMVQKEANENE